MTGVKYCSQTNSDPVFRVTPDVFWYDEKEGLEIVLQSPKKDLITGNEQVGDGMSWNQHRQKYHSEWLFDSSKLYRRDPEAPSRTLCCSYSFLLMQNNVRPRTALLAENFLEDKTVLCMERPA